MVDRMGENTQPDRGHFVAEYTTVQSVFVRHRNCLLLRADFSPLFVGYYLHLMQHALCHPHREVETFKQLLAFFALYVVSRPWKEHHAWTINAKGPQKANYFVTGSSQTQDIVGRIFTDNVRDTDVTMLYAQNICPERETHTSVVPLSADSPAAWIEEFFRASEQRQARAFMGQGDIFYLVTAEPDADYDWLNELTVDRVAQIEEQEQAKLLETRDFTYRCGCSAERIIPVVRAMMKDFADVLSEQGKLEVSCPRCGAGYTITREMVGGLGSAQDSC